MRYATEWQKELIGLGTATGVVHVLLALTVAVLLLTGISQIAW